MASLAGYELVMIEACVQMGVEIDMPLWPLPQRAEQRLPREKAHGYVAETMSEVVNTVASAIAACDQTTAGHQERVAIIACAIAREMGWNEEHIEAARLASALHDVGKFIVS